MEYLEMKDSEIDKLRKENEKLRLQIFNIEKSSEYNKIKK